MPCWGLDKYMYRVLFYLFPETVVEKKRIGFIERTFNCALQLQGENGWNPLSSLEFIIAHSQTEEEDRREEGKR